MQQAVYVRGNKQTKKNLALPETHHYIHSRQATATTSRRCAKGHIRRVTLLSLASINPALVEVSLVQLSQSLKTTNVKNTPTDTRTD